MSIKAKALVIDRLNHNFLCFLFCILQVTNKKHVQIITLSRSWFKNLSLSSTVNTIDGTNTW